ncbi:MAG TPA: bifunctional hydroxymethylpyrimidine kinase/phosphomethylpyrimidine kinase [Bryobacteraceae bacterium]|nr:bifunctional hydroxymethylpyrimidine kinase/phosphomethylpyrimidine kinase [Bryobacteraceae bacterium]
MPSIALTIAGSDPTGGAGIQADLKTFHQFGVYGEAVVTLITVQNSAALERVECLPAVLVLHQLRAVLDDMPPAAAKTGALGNRAIVEALARAAEDFRFPLVVDPVMMSQHRRALVADDALESIRRHLVPRATLLTPNLDEAAALTGVEVRDLDGMHRAARKLCEMGAKAVLVKGGHLKGDAVDVLQAGSLTREFRTPRIETRHTHGTGCTYSAAITAGLALGVSLEEAIIRAKAYITEAIRTNPGFGRGSGPLNHHAAVQAATRGAGA